MKHILIKIFIALGIMGAVVGMCHGGDLDIVFPKMTFTSINTNGVTVSQTSSILVNAYIEAVKVDFSGSGATGNVSVITKGGGTMGDSYTIYTNNEVAASFYHLVRKTITSDTGVITNDSARVPVIGEYIVVNWDTAQGLSTPTAVVTIVTSKAK